MSIVVAISANQAALPRAAAAAPVAPPRPAPRPLLVATDGHEDVRPAMRVAATVAARLRLPVHVLGRPTQTVAELAAEREAELVLVGAGWHDGVARSLGTERALDVARAAHTPVLVAGPDADGAFRRAVVGVDFDPASVRAAELACRLLSAGGTLSLVYVKQRLDWGGAAAEAWDAVCSGQVADLFRRLVAALRLGAPAARGGHAVDDAEAVWPGRRDVAVGTVTLVGDPLDELVAYAERVGADLVACGTRSDSGADRRYSTGVSAGVARRLSAEHAACSVLVCPTPPG